VTMRFEVTDNPVPASSAASAIRISRSLRRPTVNDPQHGGSAGLAISRQLVEMMGGTFTSNPRSVRLHVLVTSRFEKQEAQHARVAPMGCLRACGRWSSNRASSSRHLQAQMGTGNEHFRLPNVEQSDRSAARRPHETPPTICNHRPGAAGHGALGSQRTIRARADAKVRLVMLTHRQVDIKSARDAGIAPASTSRCVRRCCTNVW